MLPSLVILVHRYLLSRGSLVFFSLYQKFKIMANVTGKNDNFRRTWDKEEYEKRAKERLKEEDEPSSSSTRRHPPVKRELLKQRDYDVDLETNLGKSVVITKNSSMSQSGGYYCNVCDCVVKDSINFLDHINGKKHQRNLGMSMRVERSSLDQVKKRFELNKRKREEEKHTKDYDFEERMAVLKEEEELRKQQRKDFRKEKKMKVQQESEEGVDPDVAALMGFSGFGSSKK